MVLVALGEESHRREPDKATEGGPAKEGGGRGYESISTGKPTRDQPDDEKESIGQTTAQATRPHSALMLFFFPYHMYPQDRL